MQAVSRIDPGQRWFPRFIRMFEKGAQSSSQPCNPTACQQFVYFLSRSLSGVLDIDSNSLIFVLNASNMLKEGILLFILLLIPKKRN